MSAQTKTTLKTYFNSGDKPTEAQLENLIDSMVTNAETSGQTISGNITVSGNATVSGATSLHGQLTCNASANLTGNVSLTGSATAVTVAKSNNTTHLATTAYVLNQAASAGVMETATSNTEFATPGTMQRHPLMAKAWIRGSLAGGSLVTNLAYGCSATRTAVGELTVNFSTAFSAADSYGFLGTTSNTGFSCVVTQNASAAPTASSCQFFTQRTDTGAAVDADRFFIAFFGDQ